MRFWGGLRGGGEREGWERKKIEKKWEELEGTWQGIGSGRAERKNRREIGRCLGGEGGYLGWGMDISKAF